MGAERQALRLECAWPAPQTSRRAGVAGVGAGLGEELREIRVLVDLSGVQLLF